MKTRLRFINPKSIVTQITAVVLAAVLLGVLCTSAAFLFLFSGWRVEPNPKLVAASTAARIATVLEDARQSTSMAGLKGVLEASRWPEMHIEITPSAAFFSAAASNSAPAPAIGRDRFVEQLQHELRAHWGLPQSDLVISSRSSVVARINDRYALVFQGSPFPPFQRFIFVQVVFAVATITVVMLFLAVYAIIRLTAPLSSIAAAAHSLGHISVRVDPINEIGPEEISQVARALNHMHGRLQSLLEERTRMLAAISHDLRTPLTRLRLRIERQVQATDAGGMLDEIETIDVMISETLMYLRDENEQNSRYALDLPSLIQTICNEFSDVGFDVLYSGPPRMAYFCEASGIRRAIANIIDNATKHGSKVVVSLATIGETEFEIQISDDGPGIPKELQAKVFEPFYKGDDARSFIGRGGFGLGLSIVRDVVSRHSGTISFSDNDPSGLIVRLSFDRSLATTDPVRTASRINPAHQPSPGEGSRSLSR
jgi:signal transduction histidine kinase